MKTCPDCAEQVQDKANVCKHCSYRFDGQMPQHRAAPSAATHTLSAPTPTKSGGVAILLSCVLTGLGHFYLREWGRGASFMIAVICSGLIALLAPAFLDFSLVVWIALSIWAAIDANSGVHRYNANIRHRELQVLSGHREFLPPSLPRLPITPLFLASVVLVVVAIVAGSNSGTSSVESGDSDSDLVCIDENNRYTEC